MSTTTIDATPISRTHHRVTSPPAGRTTSTGTCSNCSTTRAGWVYVPVCPACGNVGLCDDEGHPGIDALDTLNGIPSDTNRRGRRLERRHGSLGWESLTETELRTAQLVAAGMTNRQVAARVFSSPHTVGSHLRNIFRKLEIGSRVELTRLVVERRATHGPSPAQTRSQSWDQGR